MDKTDELILRELKANSSSSMREIAKKTKVPLTTVHSRINHLKKIGIIKGFTVILDNYKLGKRVIAYIHISIDYNLLKNKGINQNDIVDVIKTHPAVESADTITGLNDIIIRIRMKNIEEIDNFLVTYLRKIIGVKKTVTSMVLYEGGTTEQTKQDKKQIEKKLI